MPSTYLIVGAFTDCIGSFKYNYTLSVKRAKYVVNYLKQKGLPSNRFVSNGYSKNYTITPCTVSLNKKAQQNNRRAEIVLSDIGNTNWAKLEKDRGKSYYAVYDSKKNIIPVQLKAKPFIITTTAPAPTSAPANSVVTKAVLSKIYVKKSVEKSTDLAAATVGTSIEKNKLNVSIANGGPSINQTMNVAPENNSSAAVVKKSVLKNNVEDKPVVAKKVDSISKVVKPIVVKTNKATIVAAPSTYVDDEISKAEILIALDSLAKLRIEQERIVEYLTKRINKKPIDVMVSSDSVTIEIYDNAVHDKDSVSIIFNNRIIVDKQELKVNKPIKFKLKVNKDKKFNEMIMVAENLGAEPPNTAVMFVTEKMVEDNKLCSQLICYTMKWSTS